MKPSLSALDISPEEARYFIDCLMDEGRFSIGDMARFRAKLRQEIASLEAKITSLRSGEAQERSPDASAAAPKRLPARLPVTKRRRRKASGTAVSQSLQGQYISLIRQIDIKDRPKYSAITKDQGREAAIAAMRKALGR